MSFRSPFEKPNLKAQSNRNPFDVSYKTVFHSPFGMILPCGFWRVNPDDAFEISCENQLVTPQLVRPAFMRLKEHIDYFFVPMSSIYTPSDNILTGQDYYFSSIIQEKIDSSYPLSPKVPSLFPLFDGSFLKALAEDVYGRNDVSGNNWWYGTMRLLDLLRYGNYYGADIEDTGTTASDVNLDKIPAMNYFALACYQKAYYDYYRNSMYESNHVHAYNIDDLNAANIYNNQDYYDNSDRFRLLFEPHYRWLKKDYFTCTRSNTLANTNMIGFNGLDSGISNGVFSGSSNTSFFAVPGAGRGVNLSNPLNTSTTDVSQIDGYPNMKQSGESVEYSVSSASVQSYNNIALPSVSAIRFAFAYDKLLRRMREAGQDFDKQMLAQFGIAPIDQRHGKCYRIGGFVNRINAQSVDVTSSSDTGNIAGKLDTYSVNQKPLKFHAKEFGFIIALYSTSIDTDYSVASAISRDNVACSRFDFYNPAFENLGLQPIFRFEYELAYSSLGDNRSVIGLNPRYMEYKTHIDEVHGVFCNNLASQPLYDFVPWTTQYDRHLQSGDVLSMYNMIHSPSQFNAVTGVIFNDEDWTTDPFKINLYHRVHKLSNMSVYGEDFH